ncbi:MAG TPA: hypothetical protein VKX17_22135 [Planctomycetota bacterium]|nr:hypothetical protein [Planctomycetota bacterium]
MRERIVLSPKIHAIMNIVPAVIPSRSEAVNPIFEPPKHRGRMTDWARMALNANGVERRRLASQDKEPVRAIMKPSSRPQSLETMKLRFRFSLRTLLLAVLLIGSGATLWWNWGPWTVAFKITEPGPFECIKFSDDGSLLAVIYVKDASYQGENVLDVRETATGKSKFSFAVANTYKQLEFRDSIIILPRAAQDPFGEFDSSRHLPILVEIATGKRLNFDYAGLTNISPFPAEFGTQYALFHRNDLKNLVTEDLLVKLPDFAPVRKLDRSVYAYLTADDRLLVQTEHQGDIFDLRTGTTMKFKFDELIADYPFCGSKGVIQNTTTQVGSGGLNYYYIFDAQSGKCVLKVAGSITGHNDDGSSILVSDGSNSLKLYSPFICDTPLVVPPDAHFLPGNDFLIDDLSGTVIDVKHHKRAWHRDAILDQTENDSIVKVDLTKDGLSPIEFASAETGEFLNIHPFGNAPFSATFAKNAYLFVASRFDPSAQTVDPFAWHGEGEIAPMTKFVFRLRRPWQWYGPAYLPEFWLTTILALALSWSLYRDRKTLKPKTVKP